MLKEVLNNHVYASKLQFLVYINREFLGSKVFCTVQAGKMFIFSTSDYGSYGVILLYL